MLSVYAILANRTVGVYVKCHGSQNSPRLQPGAVLCPGANRGGLSDQFQGHGRTDMLMVAGSAGGWWCPSAPSVLTRTYLPRKGWGVEPGVPSLPPGYVAACAAWSAPGADELRVRAWLVARLVGGADRG